MATPVSKHFPQPLYPDHVYDDNCMSPWNDQQEAGHVAKGRTKVWVK